MKVFQFRKNAMNLNECGLKSQKLGEGLFFLPCGLMLLILVFSLAASAFHHQFMFTSLAYFVYQIVCVGIPGMALVSLLRLPCKNQVILCALSAASGYIIAVFAYLACIPFGSLEPLWFMYALFLLGSAFVFCRRMDFILSVPSKKWDSIAVLAIVFVVLVIYFIVFAGSNYIPTEVSGNSYYCDNLYWIGNTVELGLEYPPVEFRTLTENYRYHMFSSMQLATVKFFIGLPVANLTFFYSYIQIAVLMGLCFYGVFSFFSNRRSLVVLACLVFFLTSGEERVMLITWMHHLYLGLIDSGIALSLGMLFVMLCYRMFNERESRNVKGVVFSAALFFAAFGIKATASVLLLMFLFVMCFIGLFRKEIRWFSVGIGAALLLSCFICFALFVGDFSVAGKTLSEFAGESGVSYFINSATVSLLNFYMFFYNLPFPLFINEVLYVIFYTVCGQPAVMFFIFTGILIKAVRPRSIDQFDIALLVMCISGIVLLRIIGHGGLSQTQFFTGIYPFGILFGVKALSELLCSLDVRPVLGNHSKPKSKKEYIYRHRKTLHAVCMGVLVCVLIAGVFCNVRYNWGSYLQYHAKKGLSYYIYGDIKPVPVPLEEDGIKNSYTTYDDYLTYSWARENTDPEALFVVDKTLMYSSYVFEPGAFMERHVYNPGASNDYSMTPDTEEQIAAMDVISKAFNGDRASIGELSALGVEYMVCTSEQSSSLANSNHVEEVYSGKTSSILKILK